MRFHVIHDALQSCPYLPQRSARMPLRLPLGPVTPPAFDEMLSEGDRRYGPLVYRTECPTCVACEPLRVPVARFEASRSQRRVWRRNCDSVEVQLGEPRADDEHVTLFNRHKTERGLALDEGDTDRESYRFHLVQSCVDTREVSYRVGGRLVAVSILDLGERAASSVYHYFDPDESDRSLGVYSVLKEIAMCCSLGLEWYYLGLFVADCRSLAYKAQYFPHERRVGGIWQPFARGS